jgi:tetratricopeptide (TPR) repeat protein
MKRVLLLFALILIPILVFCQKEPFSYIREYNKVQTDEEKGLILLDWFDNKAAKMSVSDRRSAFLNISTYFQKQKDLVGTDYSDVWLTFELVQTGDVTNGLKRQLIVLKRAEKRNDSLLLCLVLGSMAECFNQSGDYLNGLKYSKKAASVALAIQDKVSYAWAISGIGQNFAAMGQTDSAFYYAQKTVSLSKNSVYMYPIALRELANRYIDNDEHELGRLFLKKSLDINLIDADTDDLGIVYNSFAKSFLSTMEYDSSIFYAKKGLSMLLISDFKPAIFTSYEIIYQNYEKLGLEDSIHKYFKLAMNSKDEIMDAAKLSSIQAMGFQEEIRQNEINTEQARIEEERTQHIQYAGIGIGFVLFISLFFLMSRSIVVTDKFISFVGILGLLIFFEFINLILHPFVGAITHHSPALMLCFMVLLAAAIIPLHHKIEYWLIKKVTAKNKVIRLAAAKKIIEEIESNN